VACGGKAFDEVENLLRHLVRRLQVVDRLIE